MASSVSDQSVQPQGSFLLISPSRLFVLFQVSQFVFLVGADVCVVGVARTPMGDFLGSLSSITAPRLGSIAIEGSVLLLSLCLFFWFHSLTASHSTHSRT